MRQTGLGGPSGGHGLPYTGPVQFTGGKPVPHIFHRLVPARRDYRVQRVLGEPWGGTFVVPCRIGATRNPLAGLILGD